MNGFRLVWFALLLLQVIQGCACEPPPLATLARGEGGLYRDYVASINNWQVANVGATFEFGEALRTEPLAMALIVFDDEAQLKVEPATIVRFERNYKGGSGNSVLLETGSVTLEAALASLTLQTELGAAIVSPGSIVHFERLSSGSRLRVDLGTAELDPGGPNQRTLARGELLETAIGAAVVDAVPSSAASTPAPAQSRAASPDSDAISATVQSGRVLLLGQGATRQLTAGTHLLAAHGNLDLNAQSVVELTRQGRTLTLLGAGRYTLADAPTFLRVDRGTLDLRGNGADNELLVPGGWVQALGSKGDGIVQIRRLGEQTEVFVKRGHARVKQGEHVEELAAGQGARLDGRRILVQGRSAPRHDVLLPAAGNPVLHRAQLPLTVGVNVSELCDGIGLLELLDGTRVTSWASGAGIANLPLTTGSHTYRVRCLEDSGELTAAKASGRITLVADSGARQLPQTPPSNVVHADGRRYTLLYQSRLPSITLSWLNAPVADAYTLQLTSRGRTRTFETHTASYMFPSGGLGEGEHSFQFVSALGRRSRLSVVNVQFDNVAPKASITAPSSGSFAAGESVAIQGNALPGWNVSVQGRVVPTDEQGRFSGTATADESGITFVFSSPGRGTHYYLRSARSAPH